MKTYTQDELDEVLRLHQLWFCGNGGSRANLNHANLNHADLSDADLRYANLNYANLNDANLSDANLSYADLSDANLRSANLSHADLRSANLSYANLSDADLSHADLRSANLNSANLSDADLSYADLSYAVVWMCAGVLSCTVAFSDHGEQGRPLLCVVIDNQPAYFCGCFRGSEQELRGYINASDCDLRETRTIAVDFVSAQIKRMLKGGVE